MIVEVENRYIVYAGTDVACISGFGGSSPGFRQLWWCESTAPRHPTNPIHLYSAFLRLDAIL